MSNLFVYVFKGEIDNSTSPFFINTLYYVHILKYEQYKELYRVPS